MLAPLQEELILHALELENISVREIMVPRPRHFLPARQHLRSKKRCSASWTSSTRVFRFTIRSAVRSTSSACLYAKDLMRWLRYRVNRTASGRPVTRPSGLEVRHIMREVLVVP